MTCPREADDELEDREYPDESEADDGEEGDETIPCPHCGEPVYEDAERCPSCGRFLSREEATGKPPWWIVLGVLICLAVVLGWAVR